MSQKKKNLKKTFKARNNRKSKAFIGRQAKISSSMKLALATGRYALSMSRLSHYPIDILTLDKFSSYFKIDLSGVRGVRVASCITG